MDTRFIESFVTVVEKGSIAEAARRLNLTPAGVAQQVRALERDIGKPLMRRDGRTVKPTEVGIAILDGARALLRQARELRAVTADDTVVGELRLGSTSTALAGILPPILASFTRNYPQVRVYLVPGVSVELYHNVLRGELDAAIIVQPRFDIPKTCSWMTLRTEPLVVLTPIGMPAEDPHGLLKQEPFIRYDRNHWGGQVVDHYLRHVGIRPREHLELSAIDAIAALVARGLGISLVPDWASPWPVTNSIAKLPILDNDHVLRIGLLSANMSPSARLVRLLRQEAMATFDAVETEG